MANLGPDTLAAVVSRLVTTAYDLRPPPRCSRLHEGLNDAYLIETATDRFVLKLYRAGWRTREEVLYEVDALLHLHGKGVPVACPLPASDGSSVQSVPTAEGERQAVLFTHAGGVEAACLDPALCRRMGHIQAAVHNAADDFHSPHPRFALDLDHLLTEPLARLEPLLAHRDEDWQLLLTVASVVRRRVEQQTTEGVDWGFCHGDLVPQNVRFSGDQFCLFDFECSGPGWRASDLALFHTYLLDERAQIAAVEPLWEAFLEGYRTRRPLRSTDLALVSTLAAAKQVWVLGIHAWLWHTARAGHLEPVCAGVLPALREWLTGTTTASALP
jgi:Ser/Thr protein kinase RdoA (MazF antagonist)